MLKAGGAGFFFPAVSPQFLPHLPLQHPESVPFARRWETLACTERLDARGRRLGVVLSMNSFTRMQSFIVRLRHLQTRGTTGSRKVGGPHLLYGQGEVTLGSLSLRTRTCRVPSVDLSDNVCADPRLSFCSSHACVAVGLAAPDCRN
ncbi:uncharacterized protein LOC140702201 isoform X4 [Pogona vitticeps]